MAEVTVNRNAFLRYTAAMSEAAELLENLGYPLGVELAACAAEMEGIAFGHLPDEGDEE